MNKTKIEWTDIKCDSNYRKYLWVECVSCHQARWVVLYHGKPQSPMCRKCAPIHRSKESYKRGKDNPSYKRGWKINKDGYKESLIQPYDFFYPMAKKGGYVLEHRLVMAKHLGRCLHRSEIVHHRNGKRRDNRLVNLQLIARNKHVQLTILETRIKQLEVRVTLLEAENIVLKSDRRLVQ